VAHVHLKDFAVTDRRDESRPHLFHPGGGGYRPAPVGAGVAPIEDLVRALVLSFEMLATAMHEDLVDIWKRMDALEQRVRCQVGGFDVRRLQGKKR